MIETLAGPASVCSLDIEEARTGLPSLMLAHAKNLDDPALAADLAAIAGDGGQLPLFQSPIWLRGIAEHLVACAGGEVRVLRLVDPSTGRAGVVLPLVIAREGGFKVARLLGDGVSDTLGAIVARQVPATTEMAEAVLRLVAENLADVDILRLTHLPPMLDGRPNLLGLADGAYISPDASYPVDLDPTSDTVVTRRSAYKTYQKQWRKLERREGIVVNWLTGDEEIAAGFERMVAMRRARFTRLSRADLLREEAATRFYRAMALVPESERVARLSELVVGGKPVGYIYRIDDGQRFSTIICAIDDTIGNAYAPALILFTKLFEKAAAEGYAAGDMGTGSMPYKLRFAAAENRLMAVDRGLTVKGQLAVAGFAFVREAKAWAKRQSWLQRLDARIKASRTPAAAPRCGADEE